MSREDAYSLVRRNAMPVNADEDVAKALSPAELEALFDLGYHLKRVDTIFR